MKIYQSYKNPLIKRISENVSGIWKNHPLSNFVDIDAINTTTLRIELLCNSMDNESVNIENYPDMILKLKKVSSNEIIYHELTHIIDEHNFFFTAGRSVMELHKLINKLQNPNDKKEYIQRTLRVLWDAYINGRLSKHGIFVDSMNNCLELLTGRNHEGKKDLNIKTEKYLNKVWKSSRLSIDILISIAKKIPYHRYDLL